MGGVSLKFSVCMRAHGVPNFPDPNSSARVTMNIDPNSGAFIAAQGASAKYSPGGGKQPSPAQQQKMLANALKFSRCMRPHGVPDFPDPTTGPNGGIGFSFSARNGVGPRPSSGVFQRAQRSCQSVLGGPKLR